ncbi:MAG TPA: FAD-dependent oxidoreductase [Candidatus Sulfotelmatobacter sp.]|nr:FAD-dependent oxidoreductase [Candidatus Sulfotelmatobacter sp.]
MKSRAAALEAIQNQSFDVCVIGGGATGCGCALDAQLRGLRTVLVEAGDFASATSSASTKMAHGGVRYLEQAIREFDPRQFKVLKRALHERQRMLRNAPFLTRTQLFLTPCFRWFDVCYLETGLKLYDWIAGRASLAPSFFVSRGEIVRRMPSLAAETLIGAVAYADGQFDDARFNLTLAKSFTEAGGEAVNYLRVTAFEKGANGKLAAAQAEDEVSGHRFEIRARVLINATGPFADTIRQMATPAAAPRMRLSKGVHILLPLEVLSSADALLIPKTEDGRVLFAIPWMGRLLVGTTEQEVNSAHGLFVTREEVGYILRYLNRYLASRVTQDQIVSAIAGVRPLVSSGDSRDTKKLARDHEVEIDRQSGLISILGGKWTTYRAMAEDTIDAALRYLGSTATRCRTQDYLLLGSDGYFPDYWQLLAKEHSLLEATARHLAKKYGVRASELMTLIKEDASLGAPLFEGLPSLRAQVVFSVRNEMAITIEDVLARRLGLEAYGWREALRAAPSVAALLAAELGWSFAQQCDALDAYMRKIHGMSQKAGLEIEAPVHS